jgi:hypothetical protein
VTTHQGWIGVDLDGTLATYEGWQGPELIGAPIPRMVERVKQWHKEGKEVRIFTARVACGESEDPWPTHRIRVAIQAWVLKHVGIERIPVTNKKDFAMVELWDDRAVQVTINTGERVDGGV